MVLIFPNANSSTFLKQSKWLKTYSFSFLSQKYAAAKEVITCEGNPYSFFLFDMPSLIK